MRLVENTKTVVRDALAAGSMQTAANSVNMSGFSRCRILVVITTSSSSGNTTITLKQGTVAAASTALAFAEYWKCETMADNTAGDDALTLVSAATLTTAGAGTATSLYVFEVRADMLDSATFGSENKYIRCDISAGSNITAISLIYELYEPRHARGAVNMQSVNT